MMDRNGALFVTVSMGTAERPQHLLAWNSELGINLLPMPLNFKENYLPVSDSKSTILTIPRLTEWCYFKKWLPTTIFVLFQMTWSMTSSCEMTWEFFPPFTKTCWNISWKCTSVQTAKKNEFFRYIAKKFCEICEVSFKGDSMLPWSKFVFWINWLFFISLVPTCIPDKPIWNPI